jgi:hypothetical protein
VIGCADRRFNSCPIDMVETSGNAGRGLELPAELFLAGVPGDRDASDGKQRMMDVIVPQ